MNTDAFCRCPGCGECSAHAAAREGKPHVKKGSYEAVFGHLNATPDELGNKFIAMRDALERTEFLFQYALPKFNWGASALDAPAIKLLNEVPREVSKALDR